jgi:putative (di)nucleoside polyphosphate hydrolase
VYRSNVSLIVFRDSDKKFLIVHKPRERHAWQFPQGGIEGSESLEDSGKREMNEELGTDKFEILDSSKHVYFYDYPNGEEHGYQGQKQKYLWVRFYGEEEDVHLDRDELDNCRWVYEEELGKYLEEPSYLNRIRQVISEMSEKEF